MAHFHRFRCILDICCGTGDQCIMLHEAGFRVAGVDLSLAMLKVARKKAGNRIPFCLEDATNLHFPDRSFDCAIISFALHEKDVETRSKVLDEARRVLFERGKIVIADFLLPSGFASKTASGMVHLIERAAGRQHYRNFRSYMERGALQGLLESHQLQLVFSRAFHFRNVGVVLAEG